MELIACPSCGHQGKVPDQLLGKKIKCQVCGMSFQSAAPIAPQVGASRGASIEVDGLEVSNWVAMAPEAAGRAPDPSPEPAPAAFTASSTASPEQAPSGIQYKVLTQKDKWFEGKFDLSRLECALNHYASQGWVVRAMSTPHIMGFSGGPREELVVLLERSAGK